jgi:AhpD family alkylhydroperoxidase
MEITMSQRINYIQQSPELFRKYQEFSAAIRASSLDDMLIDLVQIRASQLNGCAFCLDMHVKEAKIHGERELRLYHVAIWRESKLFSDRERAALLWTEALTRLPTEGVGDDLFDKVRAHFSDKELSELSFAIMAINGWNRLSIGFAAEPGSADAAYGLDRAGLN